jgi:hypothetical protein
MHLTIIRRRRGDYRGIVFFGTECILISLNFFISKLPQNGYIYSRHIANLLY